MSSEVSTRPHYAFHHSAGAVVIDNGRCLLVRRHREWAFPKGHLEEGEAPERAAAREVAEETGIEIEVDASLGPTRFEFKSKNGMRNRKLVDWFLAHPTGGEISHEPIFDEVRYVELDEALRLLTHDADRELLEKAIATLATVRSASEQVV